MLMLVLQNDPLHINIYCSKFTAVEKGCHLENKSLYINTRNFLSSIKKSQEF